MKSKKRKSTAKTGSRKITPRRVMASRKAKLYEPPKHVCCDFPTDEEFMKL